MIDTICSEFPYYVLILSFIHAMLFNRSNLVKCIPARNSFFFRFAFCCLISILVKYPFNGPRPRTRKNRKALLQKKRKSGLLNLPVVFSQLKNKYGPTTGTPSSHSVVSGYLIAKLFKLQYSTGISLFLLIIPISRIIYKHHYTYQVLIGLSIGWILNRVFYL